MMSYPLINTYHLRESSLRYGMSIGAIITSPSNNDLEEKLMCLVGFSYLFESAEGLNWEKPVGSS